MAEAWQKPFMNTPKKNDLNLEFQKNTKEIQKPLGKRFEPWISKDFPKEILYFNLTYFF